MGIFDIIKKDVNILANNIPGLGTQLKKAEVVYETEKAVAKNILSTFGLAKAEPIYATNSNSALGQIGAAVANNPKTSALLLAIPASSTARTVVASTISKLPASVKVVSILATPVVAGFAVNNPVSTTKAVLETPSGLNNIGANVGKFSSDPTVDNAKNIFKENPVLISELVALGILGTGVAVAGPLSNILSTNATNKNTKSIEESNKLIKEATGSNLLPPTPQSLPVANPQDVPLTPQTQVLGKEVVTKSQKRSRKPSNNGFNALKLQILNQNNYIASS
jgi:hypothetical protein